MRPSDCRPPNPAMPNRDVPPGYKNVRVVSNNGPRILRTSQVVYVPTDTQYYPRDHQQGFHRELQNQQQTNKNGFDDHFEQQVYQEEYPDQNCQENIQDGCQQEYQQEYQEVNQKGYQEGYQEGYQLEYQQDYNQLVQNGLDGHVYQEEFQQPAEQHETIQDHNQEHFYGQQPAQQIVQGQPLRHEPMHSRSLMKFTNRPLGISKKRTINGAMIERRAARTPCIKSFKDSSRNFPVPMSRPSFSYKTLCIFAILNAPNQHVTPAEVYFFMLHHFPYYRYATNNWKNSVRNALCKQFFEVLHIRGYPSCVYSIRDKLKKEEIVKQTDWTYIKNEDPRGIEFYNRIINGEVGLPRQLFYHVVGNNVPHLAGPENSALFYNLIAIKYIPQDDTTIFREYYTEHMGTEPKHVEKYMDFNAEYTSCIENLTSYGAALKPGETMHTPSKRGIELFHKCVEKYFLLQRYSRDQNLPNWSTPNVEIVHKLFDNMLELEESNGNAGTECDEEVFKKLVPDDRGVAPTRSSIVPMRSGPTRVRPPPLLVLPTNGAPARSASVPVRTAVVRKVAIPNRPASVPVKKVAQVPHMNPVAEMVPRAFLAQVEQTTMTTPPSTRPVTSPTLAQMEPVATLAPMAPNNPLDFVDDFEQNLLQNFKATDTLSTLNGSRSHTISPETIENMFNESIHEVEQHKMHNMSLLHEFFPGLQNPSPPKFKKLCVAAARPITDECPVRVLDPASINLF